MASAAASRRIVGIILTICNLNNASIRKFCDYTIKTIGLTHIYSSTTTSSVNNCLSLTVCNVNIQTTNILVGYI